MKTVICSTLLLMLAVTEAAAQAPGPASGASAKVDGKPAASRCRMVLVGDLPVQFRRHRPIVAGEVNGQPIRVLLDTGASGSMLYRSTARRLGLKEQELSSLARSAGVGGVTQLSTADLESFRLGTTGVKNFKVIVGGEGRSDVDMLLGEDFFSQADIEFDLRNDRARVLRPLNCQDDEMPYWAKGPYSETPLVEAYNRQQLVISVTVNATRVRAILDSGASHSVITPAAARRAGMQIAGDVVGRSRGIGAQPVASRLGAMERFVVGDEVIGHPRIVVEDMFARDTWRGTESRVDRQFEGLPEMLLGADFLAAHHVLISRAHNMIYFTYEGGPVFEAAPRTPAAPELSGDKH